VGGKSFEKGLTLNMHVYVWTWCLYTVGRVCVCGWKVARWFE